VPQKPRLESGSWVGRSRFTGQESQALAALDDLLARVPDAALRTDLQREIAPLRGDQTLGLVFERHLPERVRLYGHAIRRGLIVADTKDSEDTEWLVLGVRQGKASLRRRDESGAYLEAERDAESLVVIRQFGDPIYPGLRSVARVDRGGDKAYHPVIMGENYHVLETLLFSHEGKIDAIFIDPPYNTGARDWKYNNDYVNRDDRYRHSKWLAMMERRLRLAKRLLRPERSVLIVSIDENEVHRLGLLLEDLFPSSKIQMITAMINPAGAHIIDQFSRVDEHLFFVHQGTARPIRTTADTTPGKSKTKDAEGNVKPFQWTGLLRRGGNSRREDTKEKFFPVYIHEAEGRIVGCGDSVPLGVNRADAEDAPTGCIAQWPIKRDGSEACWQLSPPTFREYLNQGRVRIAPRKKGTGRFGLYYLTRGDMVAIEAGELVVEGNDERGALIVRNAEEVERRIVGKTMWTNDAYNARENGTKLLPHLIPGRIFPFPKSLYLVEDALRFYVGTDRNAIVLDFFAGSGTTAHAVMRLNREDNGSRTCITVTNNEVSESEAEALRAEGHMPSDPQWAARGIFEFVTKPRLIAAATGMQPDGTPIGGEYRFGEKYPFGDGLEENIEFFELTYEDRDSVKANAAFEAIAPILWLLAGATGPRIDRIGGDWALPDNGRYGILFNPDEWPAFTEAIALSASVTHVFIVTDSDAVFQRVAAELPSDIEAMRLYEAYLTSFAINTATAG
jgi:adenine-specific DNA-methyltransferase